MTLFVIPVVNKIVHAFGHALHCNISAYACIYVNVCCCVLGLSVLGLFLLVWREQSVPGDVVMTHRAVPPAPSQQQLSHASNSRNRHTFTQTCKDKCTYAHTDLCLHMYTLADKHTHTNRQTSNSTWPWANFSVRAKLRVSPFPSC